MQIRLNGATPEPLHCYKQGKTRGQRDAAERSDAETPDEEAWLLCGACEHRIARRREAIAVDGSHEHTFMNPHAYAYHIGCFAAAPGVVPSGPASGYWSWFPGYTWQIVNCGDCRRHLGWTFQAEGRRFYGLVLDRLSS